MVAVRQAGVFHLYSIKTRIKTNHLQYEKHPWSHYLRVHFPSKQGFRGIITVVAVSILETATICKSIFRTNGLSIITHKNVFTFPAKHHIILEQ